MSFCARFIMCWYLGIATRAILLITTLCSIDVIASARTLLSTLKTPRSRSPVVRLAAHSWAFGLLVMAHMSRSECRRL